MFRTIFDELKLIFSKRRKLTKYEFKVFVIVFVLMYVIGFFMTVNSFPFSVAERFIEENPKVVDAIGPVKRVLPSFWGRWSIHYGGGGGVAEYSINAFGEHSTGEVRIKLVVIENDWVITNASMITNDNKVIILKDESDFPQPID